MKGTSGLILAISLILQACTGMIDKGAGYYIADTGNINPRPSSFIFCSNHGCEKKTTVSLPEGAWKSVRQVFEPKSSDPAIERERIREAVGLLETIVGPMTDTEFDKGGFSFAQAKGSQLDCVDESLNTTTYMVMMENDGLITEHNLLGPALRGYLINGWPHFAPVIEEKETGKRFVIDSWFYKNGKKAVVLPLEVWQKGWKPDKK
jgi:hypothetical protein